MLKSLCIAVVSSLLLSSGCAVRETVDFHVNDDIVLRVKVDAEDLQSRGVCSFNLERPVVVQGSDQALILELPPQTGDIGLAIETAESVMIDYVLDADFAESLGVSAQPENVTFSVPLASGTKFDRFTLSYGTRGASAAEMFPVYAGFGAAAEGVFREPAPLVDARIAIDRHVSNPHESTFYDISAITDSLTGIARVAFGYSYEPVDGEPCNVTLAAKGAGGSVRFAVKLREGRATVYLYEGMCGFAPETVEVLVEGHGFSLTSLEISEVPDGTGAGVQPLPIDMGGLIIYPMDRWRNEDYELFSWNLRPEILIVDTVSYAVQSEFFKRLAFFVEKSGSAGSLLSDEKISGKHGWNAHDYQAEDLARFFNRAKAENFQLGERELLLREILVNRGIIRDGNGVWLPGAGGLLSLSQESTPRLRELFMAHEGYHGIFFTDPGYRKISFAVWSSLSPLEQRFWREFLALREYNVNDEFLVVNEFQAYLMQVSHDNLEAYYWDYSVPALVDAEPKTGALVIELEAAYPDTFHRSALALENYLLIETGVGAADLFCLRGIEG
ncbi:MAG: hypothetical protein JW852_10915 [Spirochaetales bacterium]|nr:hypothetical protein [Spirochaetales bacterium]